MARINKSELTKLEIVQAASSHFLNNGYTNTSVKAICDDLDMSTGNLTFYFPTKEHLLGSLVDIFCDFQCKLMEEELQEGYSSIMAICLELAAMVVMCEEDENVRDIFYSAYTKHIPLEVIRENDKHRAMSVFRENRPGWSELEFTEAELLVSGIEYITLTTICIPMEMRIKGALQTILALYGVPVERIHEKIQKVLELDYRALGIRALKEFKEYVEESNEQALADLLMN